jgi:hypothetical protein
MSVPMGMAARKLLLLDRRRQILENASCDGRGAGANATLDMYQKWFGTTFD